MECPWFGSAVGMAMPWPGECMALSLLRLFAASREASIGTFSTAVHPGWRTIWLTLFSSDTASALREHTVLHFGRLLELKTGNWWISYELQIRMSCGWA